MRSLRRALVGLALAALLAAPAARAQGDINLRVDRVDADAFPNVRVFATVTDGSGRAVTGIPPEAFVLREGGNAAGLSAMADVPPDEVELRVVLAIDISGSVEPALESIKQAAVAFVDGLGDRDQVALVFFGNTARVAEPFTPDHGLVRNRIVALTPGDLEDYTALYNGVFESVRAVADQATVGRRAVVVLTDGNNTTPPGSDSLALTDVQRAASERRVPVHVIAVGDKISEQELRIIATDGQVLRVDQPDQLAAAYGAIGENLRRQYVLSYTSQLPADSRSYPLELTVDVAERGTAQATANLTALPPLVPLVRLAAPSQIAVGEAAPITVEIIARNAPATGELLLDGNVVLREPLSGTTWAPTWVPAEDLGTGQRALEVRVTDAAGVVGAAPAVAVELLPAGSPVEAVAAAEVAEEAAGVPLWVWILIGAVVLIGAGLLVFFLARRRGAQNQTLGFDGATYPVPIGSPMPPTDPPIGGQGGFGMVSVAGTVPQVAMVKPIAPTQQDYGDALGPGAPTLTLEQGRANRNQAHLRPDRELVIGRAPGCDIIPDDPKVSSQHARIRYQENGYTIFDLNSANGLWVNERRTSRLRLQDNDRVRVGQTVFVFKQPRGGA